MSKHPSLHSPSQTLHGKPLCFSIECIMHDVMHAQAHSHTPGHCCDVSHGEGMVHACEVAQHA